MSEAIPLFLFSSLRSVQLKYLSQPGVFELEFGDFGLKLRFSLFEQLHPFFGLLPRSERGFTVFDCTYCRRVGGNLSSVRCVRGLSMLLRTTHVGLQG